MAESATQMVSQYGSTDQLAIRVENVTKLFRTPSEGTIGALQEVSMDIGHSEFVTVVGPKIGRASCRERV